MLARAVVLLGLFGLVLSGKLNIRPLLDGYIIGGIIVSINDFPYQLSLSYGGSHICGASIMAKSWALSAGHCTPYTTATNYALRAGSNYSYTGGNVYKVQKFYRHPNFNSQTLDCDVSLFKISGSFKIGAVGVATIPLTSVQPATGQILTVSGWGVTQEGGDVSKVLYAVELNMYDWKQCNSAYGKNGGITKSMICASKPGKDSCQGDSGGPLVGTINNKLVQVGIVSWGIGCARPKYPGVYTDISNATVSSWITSTMTSG